MSTDDDGRFDFATSAGRHRLFATSKYGRSNSVEVSVEEKSTEEVQLLFDPRGRLTVTIEGLRSAEVALLRISQTGKRFARSEQVRKNGVHQFYGVGSGEFTLSVTTSMNRELVETFALHGEDDEAHVDISFAGSSRLFGSLVGSEDRPVRYRIHALPKDSALVSSFGESHDGEYEIRGLDDGTYLIEVYRMVPHQSLDELGVPRSNIEVEVAGDTNLDIQLGTVTLSGTVLPPAETAGAVVSLGVLSNGISSRVSSSVTDETGRFEFKGLSAATYSVSVHHKKFFIAREMVLLRDSQFDMDISLQRRPTGMFVLSGIVQPVGESIGAIVSLRHAADHSSAGVATTDENGLFQIEGLHEDEYELVVVHEDFQNAQETLSVESSIFGMKISLKPLGTLVLSGTVHPIADSEGTVVTLERSSDGLSIGSVRTDRWGHFEFNRLNPDEYVMYVYHEEFQSVKQNISIRTSRPKFDVLLKSRSREL